MIKQLRKENYNLRIKEKDYAILNNQLQDLEYRFNLLQEEKARQEVELREKEGLYFGRSSALDGDLSKLHMTLSDHELTIKQGSVELETYKRMVEDKNAELAKLKKDLMNYEGENVSIFSRKKSAEVELEVAKSSQKIAQSESDSLYLANERLKKDKMGSAEKLRGAELEVSRLQRKIEDAELELRGIQSLIAQRDRELSMAREGRLVSQSEGDHLLLSNSKLRDEKSDLLRKKADLELQLQVASKRLDDELYLADIKDKELRSMRSGVSLEETRGFDERETLKKLHRENETLNYLLDKYRDDVNVQRRLRNEETTKKLELSAEKKRVEREALMKDIETRAAQRELETAKSVQSSVTEDQIQLSQELSAVRDHADVLEHQNYQLHRELDQFADTNEKVRRELDRKDRVDYLRNKNDSEYQQSMSRVLTASPGKSPSKSPYHTPSRSPSKPQRLITIITVSYTHLTLPTIPLVQISVVAGSLKKKKQNKTKLQRNQEVLLYLKKVY
eukprot:TRINITY_DN1052_c0_g1_i1.p1 TRINITY_DN1052_c0_g1~~TRINITY_DN1052_c0_g1_i1.p1  ORF type:complete len:570 (-),score=136.84 TRINITY_DN1052_c0_g1_i1:11-1525(-)